MDDLLSELKIYYYAKHVYNFKFLDSVIVTLTKNVHDLEIRGIESLSPGNGDGTKAMEFICHLADRHEVIIWLLAEPFNSKFLNLNNLVNFYQKFNFIIYSCEKNVSKWMYRNPI